MLLVVDWQPWQHLLKLIAALTVIQVSSVLMDPRSMMGVVGLILDGIYLYLYA